MPEGVYFNGPFSITGWFYARETRFYSRFVDIGSTTGQPNIYFSIFNGADPTPYIRINNNGVGLNKIISCIKFNLTEWTHTAAAFDGTNLKLFMNGKLVGVCLAEFPLNVTRKNNFIGKSWSPSDKYANAIFDEVRFYNRDLSADEIGALMSF